MKKLEVLQKYFGYTSFRKGQETLIDAILDGKDVLGVMPTGAGKSICYQVPALMLEGITIVVSPLISLMKDQVTALNQAGIHAAYINSSLNERQIAAALRNAQNCQYKIIYAAPERLLTPAFLEMTAHVKISMLTVDEAHCISQWGQDFRPSYLKIVDFIHSLPRRPVLSAFTATATTAVKEDITCILGLQSAASLVTGFDRENLYFEVRQPKKKDTEVLGYLKEHKEDSGIIYCATRKNVDKVYEMLLDSKIAVTRYHAGLSNEERQQNQEKFIYDDAPVMVATNAFGMGIDKSNVRYVIHYNMPQSMENYYQEAGRAGRDGEPSECILLYSPQDIMINQFLIENGTSGQDISYEDALAIHERDEARLNQMIHYCLTKACLRRFILQYFGEYRKDDCGNCSSCQGESEEMDATAICIDIIRCIKESRQRFGVRVVIGILRGEKYAKLLSYGVETFSSYGIQKEVSESLLQQIMNQLIVEEYLVLTKDKYSLVKLTRKADEILSGIHSVTVKYFPEREKEEAAKKDSHHRRADLLTSKGQELFESLRELRMEIAKEEKVPPYIIFSDKSLVDMCLRLPKNKAEMLAVSGVGENKFERYGEKFLERIAEETGGVTEGYAYEGAAEEYQTVKYAAAKKRKKEEFSLTEEMASKISFSEETTLSELVNQMNELRDEEVKKRIAAISIVRKMTEDGYFTVQETGEREVTPKGNNFGIRIEMKRNQRGIPYEVYYLTEEAQHGIVEMLLET